MRRILQMACCALTLFACLASGRMAGAFPGVCGGCFGPPPTLSQQLFDADGAYLARIVSKTEFVATDEGGQDYTGHYTTFELVETLKPGLADVAPRMHVVLDYEHDGSPGDYAVLLGSLLRDDDVVELHDDDSEELWVDVSDVRESRPLFSDEPASTEINWSATATLTWAGGEYLRHLPPPSSEMSDRLPAERLAYFLPFLEHPDAVVAEDAYEELDRAEFADLIPLADRLPRDKLAKWVLNAEDTGLFRRRLYGILLGLCGQREDAALLRKIALTVPSEDDEDGMELIGVEGSMIGYMLLTGERGLADLAENVLTRHDSSQESVYLVLDAIQILYYTSPETISADKLRMTIRRTLDREDAVASGIENLSMLEDWESQQRVIGLLDACGYESDEIRLAIVRYLQTSAGHVSDPALRTVAEQAEAALADLKRREPQLFDETDPFR